MDAKIFLTVLLAAAVAGENPDDLGSDFGDEAAGRIMLSHAYRPVVSTADLLLPTFAVNHAVSKTLGTSWRDGVKSEVKSNGTWVVKWTRGVKKVTLSNQAGCLAACQQKDVKSPQLWKDIRTELKLNKRKIKKVLKECKAKEQSCECVMDKVRIFRPVCEGCLDCEEFSAKPDEKGAIVVKLRSRDNVKTLELTKKEECADTCKTEIGNYPKLMKFLRLGAGRKCMKEVNSCECIQNKIKKHPSYCAKCLDCEVKVPA